jgi:hypothetical protein
MQGIRILNIQRNLLQSGQVPIIKIAINSYLAGRRDSYSTAIGCIKACCDYWGI